MAEINHLLTNAAASTSCPEGFSIQRPVSFYLTHDGMLSDEKYGTEIVEMFNGLESELLIDELYFNFSCFFWEMSRPYVNVNAFTDFGQQTDPNDIKSNFNNIPVPDQMILPNNCLLKAFTHEIERQPTSQPRQDDDFEDLPPWRVIVARTQHRPSYSQGSIPVFSNPLFPTCLNWSSEDDTWGNCEDDPIMTQWIDYENDENIDAKLDFHTIQPSVEDIRNAVTRVTNGSVENMHLFIAGAHEADSIFKTQIIPLLNNELSSENYDLMTYIQEDGWPQQILEILSERLCEPTPTTIEPPSTTNPNEGSESEGSNMVIIISCVIAAVCCVIIVGFLIYWFMFRKDEDEAGLDLINRAERSSQKIYAPMNEDEEKQETGSYDYYEGYDYYDENEDPLQGFITSSPYLQ